MPVLSTKFKFVDEISDKLKSLGTSGMDVESKLKNIGTASVSMDKVTSSTEKSTKAYQENSKVVQEYNEWHEKSVDALADYIEGVEGAEEELKKYTTVTEYANETVKKSTDGLDEAKKKHDDYGDGIDKTKKKTEDWKQSTEDAFNNLDELIATAGIVAFLGTVATAYTECITKAQDYEVAVTKVSTLADSEVASFDDISSSMLDLSKKTGVAATSLAEAEYQALSAGVSTQGAAQFVEEANMLAVGGFTQTATAVDVLTTALNAYQLDVSETSRISDVLVTTQNLGKTTVDELASSMGRIIPAAAAYNVKIEDLSTAYAIMTAGGIATAESTTYLKGMLNELASDGSAVSQILSEETGKTFTQLEADGYSLGDTLGVLYQAVDNNSTAFSNLWSSQEAGMGALALVTQGTEKYANVLKSMEGSAGTASEAYETMTSTSQHASQELQNAATNFQTSVGNKLLPVTNMFSGAATDALNALTSLNEECPMLTAVLTGAAVSIGALTIATTLYSAKTKIATAATIAFKTAQQLLSGPVGWVTLGVGALATGLIAYSNSTSDATDETEKLSVASKKQYDELRMLKSQYDNVVDAYGETSSRAQLLKKDIDDLEASFESNKETVEEYEDRIQSVFDAYDQNKSMHEENALKIASEEEATYNLIDRLEELGTKSKLTATDQQEMVNIIDILNSKMPELGLTYHEVANDIEGAIDKINEATGRTTAQSKYDEAFSKYNDAVGRTGELEKTKRETKDTYVEAKSNYEYAKDSTESAQEYRDEGWKDVVNLPAWVLTAGYDLDNAKDWESKKKSEYDSAKSVYDKAKSKYEENEQAKKDALQEMADLAQENWGITTNIENETDQAIVNAAMSVETELELLATAYDEAYSAALTSFEGQFSLWDKVESVSATSTSTVINNLDSQINYWESYADNLENLQGRNIAGLNDVIKQLDDGSAESAAILAGMANASDSELEKIVTKYNNLQEQQERTASATAEAETDFAENMDNIESKMKKSVDNLNLKEEAANSAKSTIQAYADAIRAGQSDVNSALATIIENAKAKLSGTNINDDNVGKDTPKHAIGTDYAEDVFIAGENGPELILGYEGAKVYNEDETRRLLQPEITTNYIVDNETPYIQDNVSNSTSISSEKVITIRLDGVGEFKVQGNETISKEEIVRIIAENIEPVLVGVLKDEIFEEGDDSYEF